MTDVRLKLAAQGIRAEVESMDPTAAVVAAVPQVLLDYIAVLETRVSKLEAGAEAGATYLKSEASVEDEKDKYKVRSARKELERLLQQAGFGHDD